MISRPGPTLLSAFLLVAAQSHHAARRDSPTTLPDFGRYELLGRWNVGPIWGPSHQKTPSNWADQMTARRLPLPGQTVVGKHGSFCAGNIACDEVSWTKYAVKDAEGGTRYMQDFGFAPTRALYVGDTGNKWITYTVVPGNRNTLRVVTYLCQNNERADHCYNVLETWTPAGANAKIAPTTRRR